MAMPDGSFCVYCGESYTENNSLEECPVSRYMYRTMGKTLNNTKLGAIKGQPHLWSAGHVEDWFNYSGPRGHEKGWENTK
jgi:hypothetical protein